MERSGFGAERLCCCSIEMRERSEADQNGAIRERSGALSDCSGGVEVEAEWIGAEQFGKGSASYSSAPKVLCSALIRSHLYCGSGVERSSLEKSSIGAVMLLLHYIKYFANLL